VERVMNGPTLKFWRWRGDDWLYGPWVFGCFALSGYCLYRALALVI